MKVVVVAMRGGGGSKDSCEKRRSMSHCDMICYRYNHRGKKDYKTSYIFYYNSVRNRRTDRRTDEDARTHLKRALKSVLRFPLVFFDLTTVLYTFLA